MGFKSDFAAQLTHNGNPKFVGNVRNRREITGPTTRSWHFRTLSDTGSANDCVIPAGMEISVTAAYMLIPRELIPFWRNPKHASKRVRVPPPAVVN